jgi:hypothetical protein
MLAVLGGLGAIVCVGLGIIGFVSLLDMLFILGKPQSSIDDVDAVTAAGDE